MPPEYTTFTPYRICPLGAHSDYQRGIILGFAIDKGIHIAYGSKQNGVIDIQSVQFSKCNFTYVDDIVTGVKHFMRNVPEKLTDDEGFCIPLFRVYNIGNNSPENLLDFVDNFSRSLSVQSCFLRIMILKRIKGLYRCRQATCRSRTPIQALPKGILV